MEITCIKGDILQSKADLVVIGVYKDEDWGNEFLTHVNEIFKGRMSKLAKSQDFKGLPGQSLILAAPEEILSEYVLVVGLGDKTTDPKSSVREASGVAVQTAKRLGCRTLAMEFFGEDDETFDAAEFGRAITEALLTADYKFDSYKNETIDDKITAVTIIAEDGRDARKAEKGIELAHTVIDGVTVARDLVNTPARDMTPTRLAETAENIAKMSNGSVKVKIYDREQCEKKGMNAFLSIAQGSEEEPKFIHLTYKPDGKAKKVIALVGKGVTFDSGGLSIKPADYMMTMKCDMAGAAAVLGVFATFTRTQPKFEIHGIIAATENMPSGKAIRPGDVVRAMNKKTIEITNTDAEGRVTLADALSYAGKLNPDTIIDLATLTGACVVALGEEISGIMSNNPELTNQLLSSASYMSENMWELPLFQNYAKLIKSDLADVKNISSVRYGGSLTAGLFLQNFIEDGQAWAHIDIAGPAYAEREFGSYISKGGTGYGVRTLVRWLETL
ncbi:leucyl aminopeptidase [Candidatus Uhrbacteria bacterium CG_4_9_14_0_2_um_filter_41_50]|uniref:Probable cytosol aminopeptidase n=1 Tax=Candidatus Uhrbacteria bacterium CG_4_9_14_0_2_um_filter_41_50 TaxID=1975031 RepID=A0A2M8EP51_9BACT|nr:MAG: leucyl aminopeptidase [Candidatus Uhrbacteria bacterium CG_4_10_14_3_um_filter_41_21]PIZ55066.1 MAG: leucyl aminopeptidase [Candidatus Uhrbacteria bacterium CG_4_10_14_0_2_um_filter_41_21]PJB85016.1 MAG: leucyl aminopeptidase [Candidatus Uhrbacteria bacterium CG_4_9_14_0_8_um_filter_41_16]PJC24523.1 MAG: leucyl aminopeptidase [Candidatus Uhrbacteria bacterium CG_4_9_14_0_2_um_filter_41_50]PJE74749.1 MAG: leucyl aminopeptidase [Candidatus Uhrbacteria bacterium CG10_big_fil_rev_8_21_14_0_